LATAFFAFAAFPPYRSTDADTANPGALEVRLGLLRIAREDHDNAYESPLLRINLGLPRSFELVSEFAYLPEEERVGDAAVGFKWVPLRRPFNIGIEALALLPVSSDDEGAGFESQLVATFGQKPFRLHLNAGGFYDARPADAERGWRASALAEYQWGRFRPGLELFAKQVRSEHVRVEGGPGIIIALGPIDLRTALHAGLTREAPDLIASLWLSWKWSIW
jgi:hypothetical protein